LDKGNEDAILLPRFSNHSLRHTFTTRLVEAGVGVKSAMALLGHEDAATTLQIYADSTMELKTQGMTMLRDFFEPRFGNNSIE